MITAEVVPVSAEAAPLTGATKTGKQLFTVQVGVARFHVPALVHVVEAEPLRV